MEKTMAMETQTTSLILTGKIESESKTLPEIPKPDQKNLQNPAINLRKPATPDRLRVPKAFKFPERYASPTDSVMSPISKGLLRNRRGGVLLPSTSIFSKHQIHDLLKQDVTFPLKFDAVGI